MADKKITDLTAMAAGTQASGDLLPIVDVSEAAAANKNKKVTVENLLKGVPTNVGIGTATPAANLHVKGNDIVQYVEATGSAAEICFRNNQQTGDNTRIGGSGNNLTFDTGGSESARFTNAGRFGLGTTSPDSKLDIVFDSNSALKFDSISGASGSLITSYEGSNSSNIRDLEFDVNDFIVNTGASTGTSTTQRLIINSSGNVGIGDSSPDARLHVESSTSGADLLKLANSTDTAELIIDTGSNVTNLKPGTGDAVALWGPSAEKMRVDANGVKVTEGQPISWHDGSGNNSAQISGDSSDNLILSNTSSNTERFRVGPAGQLGIGGATYGTSGQALISGGASAAPSWGTPTATAGQVIETFAALCDGRQVTVGSGTYTTSTYTAGQTISTTYVDVSGSSLTYTPPSGTNVLIYEFSFQHSQSTGTYPISSFRFYWHDGSAFQEVTAARRSIYSFYENFPTFRTALTLNNATQDVANGKIGTWNTAREIKIMSRSHSTSYPSKFHQTWLFDGAISSQNVPPVLKITAIA